MKVLLDLDGVLANFVAGACHLHNVPNPYEKNEQNLGYYEIQDLIGIKGTTFWDPMGEEFWTNLPVMEYAHTIVDILERQYGRHNICLLTSPVKTPGCIRGKMRWIRKHFPQFRRQFLIGPMKEVCAHPNSILFDDYHRNVEKFQAAGGNAFLIPGPWNDKHIQDPVEALTIFLGGNCE